jgi:glycosyltransferase involved in cell wall biosynthesis
LEGLKISIITINYNNATGLEKTIQSVTTQNYGSIEYFVIDGDSADDSKEVIKRYTDKISYWVSEPDRGIYHAMNKGIQVATGDYLLFINSGDTLMNAEVISNAAALGLDTDLVYGNLLFVKGDKKTLWKPSPILTAESFFTSSIPHPATFIKRDLFATVGLYNEANLIVSDWEFFLLATCRYNCSYRYIDLLITAFCEEGISSNPENFSKISDEREVVLKHHFSFFLEDYKKHRLVAEELRKAKSFLKARKFLKRVFGGS